MSADAAHDVLGLKLVRRLKTRCLQQFLQCLQGMVVKIFHPLGFAGYHQGHLALGVLCGDPRRTIPRVTGLRLYATQGKHETSGAVAPVGAQRQGANNVKTADDFAARTQANLRAQVHAYQGVVHQTQALQHGHAHVVRKFQRRGPCAAFCTIDNDEIRGDAGLQHGLHDGKPLPRVTHAKLKAGGFTAAQGAQLLHKFKQFNRVGKGAVRSG